MRARLRGADGKDGEPMRYLPHQIYLMARRGRQSLHGRPLSSKEEALARLRRMTGQDFGPDPEA
jgi:hypothetical protein